MRCLPSVLCLLAAACAAPSAVPRPAPSALVRSTAEAAAAANAAPERAPAEDAEDTAPLAAIVADLRLAERHGEALAAVEQALAGDPADHEARLLRVGLLRDLGRRDEAHQALAAATAGLEPRDLHPSLLLARAELEWLTGDLATARRTLASLREVHGGDAWVFAHRGALAALNDTLERGGDYRQWPVADLLGDLRGAAAPEQRLRAFQTLQQGDPETQARAAAVAAVDRHPALRIAAISRVELPPAALAEVGATALRDPAAGVRIAASRRLLAVPADLGAPVLVAGLEREEDADAALVMHEVLAALLPPAVPLPPSGLRDPAGRAALAASWRQRWPR